MEEGESSQAPKPVRKPRAPRAGKQVTRPDPPEEPEVVVIEEQAAEPKVFLLTVTTFKPYNEASAMAESVQTQRFYRTEKAAKQVAENMVALWNTEGEYEQPNRGIHSLQFASGRTACVELRNGDLVVMRLTTMRLLEVGEFYP